jgi:hypothetical protein
LALRDVATAGTAAGPLLEGTLPRLPIVLLAWLDPFQRIEGSALPHIEMLIGEGQDAMLTSR